MHFIQLSSIHHQPRYISNFKVRSVKMKQHVQLRFHTQDEVIKQRFPWYILIYFVKLPRKDIAMRSSSSLFLVTCCRKRTTQKLELGVTTTKQAFCPGFPTGTVRVRQPRQIRATNRDQRVCQRRRGRHPLWSRLVLRTGTKGPYFSFLILFSCFFWVISIPFQIEFYIGI